MLVIAWFGLPVSWPKIGSGESVQWVGHEIRLREAQLESRRREQDGCVRGTAACWRTEWYKWAGSKKGSVRRAFVCGAVDYERPLLAPLFTCAALRDPVSTPPLLLW